MIAAAHFRRGAGDREQIAAPGESPSFAANYTPSQQAWGKLTSRQPDPASRAALELAAFRLGVKPASLVQAIKVGLLNG
jgi:hypothetical protein